MQRGWRATGGVPWRAWAVALAVALATSIVGPVRAGDPPTPLLPEAARQLTSGLGQSRTNYAWSFGAT